MNPQLIDFIDGAASPQHWLTTRQQTVWPSGYCLTVLPNRLSCCVSGKRKTAYAKIAQAGNSLGKSRGEETSSR